MTIEEIKSFLTIGRVLEHYNLKPDKNNRLLCHWHNDRSPSLQIYAKTNSWTCFSTNCTAGSGDVIDFIMKFENFSKYQAILKAKTLASETLLPQPVTNTLPPANIMGRVDILTRVYAYFRQATQGNTKQFRDYISSRGLSTEKSDIGYNSGQFHHRGNKHLIESCLKVGILNPNPNGGYLVFAKHCVIFPLKNKHGEIVSLYGRSILDNKNSKHYYLRDTQGLYPGYPPPQTRKLIIGEAIIDTATLLLIDEIKSNYALLSAYGTNRLKDEHIEAIKEWAADPSLTGRVREGLEIIFFFDGDDAGIFAVKKYAEQLNQLFNSLPEGEGMGGAITISTVSTPEAEDINSLYLKYPKETILTLIGERTVLHGEAAPCRSPEGGELQEVKSQVGFSAENPEALTYQNDHLHITVLGGIKVTGLDRMKVTLKIQAKNSHYTPLRHHLDLYYSDHVARLIQTINEQLEITTSIAASTLNQLIEELEKYRISKITSLQPLKPQSIQLTEKETAEALLYAKDPDLMQNTLADIGKTGIVGEPINRLIMFLVFLSRTTTDPLHIISFGASGSGKTYLQEKVSALVPQEDKLEITALSANALYYFKRDEIKHKLLLIEDYDGAQEVLYPLRELQSKQKITKTVSLKDSKGDIKTLTFTVEGPVCVAGCTTKEKMYEDNANRCLLIYIDGSEAQDERIMEYQRNLSAGLINQVEEENYKTKLKNVQRMMKPIRVVNPFAPHLVISKEVLKPRRSNKLYIRFIELITFYHQHQREIKYASPSDHSPSPASPPPEGGSWRGASGSPYIETTLDDIAWANKLLKNILLRKSDELTAPCRSFFEYLKKHLKDTKQKTFKAKEIRSELRTNASNLKRYLPELHSSGHIKITGGNRIKGLQYEIVSYEEYETLKKSINNVLDELLEKLRRGEHLPPVGTTE